MRDVGRSGGWGGLFGSPVHVGKECPLCGFVHSDGESTLTCYEVYLAARCRLSASFLSPLQQESLYCPGCKKTVESSSEAVRGNFSCHAEVLNFARSGGKLRGLFTGKIACAGSRQTPSRVLDEMYSIGQRLVKLNRWIASGNAVGADAAFADGGLSVNPENVVQFCPLGSHAPEGISMTWRNELNKFFEPFVAPYHPNWGAVCRYGPTTVSKFMRNASLVLGARCLITYAPPGSSGSQHGARIAKALGVTVYNLFYPDDAHRLGVHLATAEAR